MAGRAYYKFQNVNSFPNLEDFLTGKDSPTISNNTPSTSTAKPSEGAIPKKVTLDIIALAQDSDPKTKSSTFMSLVVNRIAVIALMAVSTLVLMGTWILIERHAKTGKD